MSGYQLSVDLDILQQLLRVGENQRQEIVFLLERLRQQPFTKGDFQELDDTSRTNEVILAGDALVFFWSDHATKIVRVTKVEFVGED